MNKKIIVFATIVLNSIITMAQNTDTLNNQYQNSAEMMLNYNGKLGIGGYGEVHYNQPMTKNIKESGTMDVHRLVMFLGYNFTKKTQFVSEIEFEYAKELWVEQVFLQHKINKFINFRAGLMLVPMGIINEFHEPTSFNGVERPVIDNRLSLSTWREIGLGFSGNIFPASLKYQLYVMNGLSSYDTKGIFNGSSGLREGRQKGSKAYINSPSYTGKIEYYGIKNLNIGLSAYFGASQSKLYSKLHNDSTNLKINADSSVVDIRMLGLDTRYHINGFEFRGQFYYTFLTNTEQYNKFSRISGKNNDLGNVMLGYYLEVGYNVFKTFNSIKEELVPFVRYEYYNTHQSVDNNTTKNPSYKNTIITTGLSYRLNKNAVIKADVQFVKPDSVNEFTKIFNVGIGFMF
jgi:hypothetical protein